jgi:hypothetical protein
VIDQTVPTCHQCMFEDSHPSNYPTLPLTIWPYQLPFSLLTNPNDPPASLATRQQGIYWWGSVTVHDIRNGMCGCSVCEIAMRQRPCSDKSQDSLRPRADEEAQCLGWNAEPRAPLHVNKGTKQLYSATQPVAGANWYAWRILNQAVALPPLYQMADWPTCK